MVVTLRRSSFTVFVLLATWLSYSMLTLPASALASASNDGAEKGQQPANMLFNTRSAAASASGNKRNLRSIYGLGPKMLQISRSKIPIELDLLVDNDGEGDRSKRFDDYGHMRFGKRGGEEQFDDYGHMRFGRSS